MNRGIVVGFLALLAVAPAARGWEVRRDASKEDFSAFHRRFATAVYHYPRHGASSLGLVGFDVYADAAADQGFDGANFYDGAVSGDLTGGWLTVARVGARKGLPGGIDLGAAYVKVLDSGLELVSADLQWSVIDGGLVSPALAVRLTGTRTLNADAYDLDEYGAEVLVSKGFAVVTPYAGAGLVYSKGTLDRGDGTELSTDDTRPVVYAGATLNLLLPKITFEVERGVATQAALRIAIGF